MQMIRTSAVTLIISLALTSLACSGFVSDQRTRDRQSNIEQAKRDDTRCQEQGHEYPSPAYTRCRQAQQDQREQRQLFALEIIDPQQDYMDAHDPRRRLSTQRGEFRCEERSWQETRWIQCRTYPREEDSP
ncbi:hypothetical protein J2T60_000198 [Natronospira proteinivora]|uniref:Uncharacterized protein n=1 Tax=Natronospira proteinivora TaxID=1807133 RepID=A0ABT1G7D2_9GAMM|nr:hypothetical protein [Natronospira proteinivora]MCP1726233.1 hypothetical protein [Natronospira proteinivora]